MFTRYELNHLGLVDVFDGVYLSSCFGFRKPDIRFFRALLDEHQLEPRKCLMIGNDRETDIAGAKACGMATLYMHTNLTPGHQAPAKEGMLPGTSRRRKHFEYEGYDWRELTALLRKL
jgi:putative hydrolase of the HAD superfamily